MKPISLIAICAGLLSQVPLDACGQTLVRVGWCVRTISVAAAPFAVAMKMGWYAKDGIKVELVPVGGSTDCVKLVATKELAYSLPSVEPLAIIRQQGVKAKIFYTAYQGNIYGLAVPQDSKVTKVADLKDTSIGVISMSSAGVIIARALVSNAGLNPDLDIHLVVTGEGAQTVALLRAGQIDALSEYDTQYAVIENAGVKLRLLSTKEIEAFPSNGFLALEETLSTQRKQAIALAQGFAKGTVFTIANPEAAIRILWDVYPETKPTGVDEATALRQAVITLEARVANLKLEKSGVTKWGESSEKHYAAYADFMQKWGVTQEKVPANELITNDLVDDINNFGQTEIIAMAKAYKGK
ncbi:ABC transporter substrate-binding protein [Pararobbsia silviterrae]|uniref:Thiamine pyrimidine synthase n=1 Tax=Pararobbsia silviterrae TaxID=1792498 RepID=A0A494XB64_9BURK|nr:ABC transporter substrate-binding protein [Pararobbsia silviterrae]RKP47788.1 ABC transporter substrate-binding protein [Pararobbsia silviterrae]